MRAEILLIRNLIICLAQDQLRSLFRKSVDNPMLLATHAVLAISRTVSGWNCEDVDLRCLMTESLFLTDSTT